MRNRINGLDTRFADESSVMLAFSFGRLDLSYTLLTMVLSAVVMSLFGDKQTALETILGAIFGGGAFLFYRTVLAMLLFIRVCDFLRNRYAFHSLCLSGALAVVAAPGFQSAYAAGGAGPIVATLGMLAIVFSQGFVFLGGGWLLLASCLVLGGLCAASPWGWVALILAFSLRRVTTFLCNRVSEMMEDSPLRETSACDELFSMFNRAEEGYQSHFAHLVVWLIGVVTVLAVRHQMLGAELQNALLEECGQFFALVRSPGFLVIVSLACSLLVMMTACSRRATTRPLSALMITLYGIALAFALGWEMRFVDHLPLFSDVNAAAVRTQAFLPDFLISLILVISAGVFIVEAGCQKFEVFWGETCAMNAVSPRVRQWQAAAVSAAVVAIVLYSIICYNPLNFCPTGG